MKLSEALEAFFKDLEQSGRSSETVKWYDWHLRAFVVDAGNCEVASVTPDQLRDHIADYRRRADISPHTAAGRDRALRAFWRWARDEYQLEQTPLANVRRAKKAVLKPAAVDRDAWQAVLETCVNDYAGIRDRAILRLLDDTGARRSGIMSLRLADVDTGKGVAWVTEKGNPPRAAFFTPHTAAAIDAWLAIRISKPNVPALFTSLKTFDAMKPNALNQMIARRKRDAGVMGRTNPHSLRHGKGIEFGKAGQLAAGAQVLGNGIWITGEYYQRYTIDDLKALYDKVMERAK